MKGTPTKFYQHDLHHPHPLLHRNHQGPVSPPDPPLPDVDSHGSGGGEEVGRALVPVPEPAAAGAPDAKKPKTSGDGASIEVVRRPRGRPPGSKNKPKPPVVITREAPESANAMRPHILEIPAGHDVAEALDRFSRRRNLGLSILAGTGPVSNVTLRQQALSAAPAGSSSVGTVSFQGRFEILSMSATFFPPSSASSTRQPPSGGFSISLAGPQGQIVGGSVAGPLVAAGTVTVVAASFASPTYHRLPADDDLAVSVSVSDGSGGRDVDEQQEQHQQQQQQQQQRHTYGGGGASPSFADQSSGISTYSCHLPSDVIWAPPARPPHPPPY